MTCHPYFTLKYIDNYLWRRHAYKTDLALSSSHKSISKNKKQYEKLTYGLFKKKKGNLEFRALKEFLGKNSWEVLVTEKSNLYYICKTIFDDFVYNLNVLANVKAYQLLLCEIDAVIV